MEYDQSYEHDRPARDPRISVALLIGTGLFSFFVALEHDRFDDLVVPVVIVVAFAQAMACLLKSRDISGTLYLAFGVIPAAAAYRTWDGTLRAIVVGGLFAAALLVVWVRRNQYSKIEDAETKISTLHSRLDDLLNREEIHSRSQPDLNLSAVRNLRDEVARIEASLQDAVAGAVSPLQASVETLGQRVDVLAAQEGLPVPVLAEEPAKFDSAVVENLKNEMARVEASLQNVVAAAILPLQASVETLGQRVDALATQELLPIPVVAEESTKFDPSVIEILKNEMARVEASLQDAVTSAVSPLQAVVQTLEQRVEALAAEPRLLTPVNVKEPAPRDSNPEVQPFAEAAAKSLLLTAPELKPDVKRLQAALEQQGYYFGESVLQECARVLTAGKKPLVLAGPTGNGKTTLARHLPLLFWEADEPAQFLTEFEPRSDSSVADVMGFHLARDGAVVPQAGAFTKALLECIRQDGRHWLLVDALNQADVLEVFGSLLELAGKINKGAHFQPPGTDQSILVPRSFRLICTMNDSDERHLFPLPPAALRRMEIVRIETPERVNEKRALADYYQKNFGPVFESAGLRQSGVVNAEEGLENLLTALGELRAIGERHGAETMRLGMADSLDILEKACGHIVASHGAARNPFDLALRAALNQRLRNCQPAVALKSLADNSYFRSSHPEICCEASLEWTRRVTTFEV